MFYLQYLSHPLPSSARMMNSTPTTAATTKPFLTPSRYYQIHVANHRLNVAAAQLAVNAQRLQSYPRTCGEKPRIIYRQLKRFKDMRAQIASERKVDPEKIEKITFDSLQICREITEGIRAESSGVTQNPSLPTMNSADLPGEDLNSNNDIRETPKDQNIEVLTTQEPITPIQNAMNIESREPVDLVDGQGLIDPTSTTPPQSTEGLNEISWFTEQESSTLPPDGHDPNEIEEMDLDAQFRNMPPDMKNRKFLYTIERTFNGYPIFL